VRQRIERAYGFDRTPVGRYVHWLGALLFEGELGWSHSRTRPVTRALADALPPTLLLSGAAMLFYLVTGLFLGAWSALRRGRWSQRIVTLLTLSTYAMPVFWLGLMAIWVLSYQLRLFPASSMSRVGSEELAALPRLLDLLWHLILPAAVLGAASAAAMSRFVHHGMLDALGEPFVRAAKARGLSDSRLLWGHALRQAIVPVINLAGLSLPVLISGSLVVEVVFGWPGMGRLTYDAILAQDYSVVLATTMMATAFVVFGNLLADLAVAWVDPRVRLQGGAS
jgi:peptide/nickel transport system permease protein